MELYTLIKTKRYEPLAIIERPEGGLTWQQLTSLIAASTGLDETAAGGMASEFNWKETESKPNPTLVDFSPKHYVAVASNKEFIAVLKVYSYVAVEKSEEFLSNRKAEGMFEKLRQTLPKEWQRMMLSPIKKEE